MISRKELFAEISNEAVTEDGEVVGYFVRSNRMDTLEQMLCGTVTVKLPQPISVLHRRDFTDAHRAIYAYPEAEVNAALDDAGIEWEAE